MLDRMSWRSNYSGINVPCFDKSSAQVEVETFVTNASVCWSCLLGFFGLENPNKSAAPAPEYLPPF